ncbi:hypothetical protein A3K64_02345 [Candidatus Micrarchaeota archaeon RBG_16_36_9]|nr:MAG: hypothetical protein A3K64_02345 [Candidatus Micrarchaeota archaeon RBG_16_36_9]
MTKQVQDDKAFWFCNNSGCVGKVAHNLQEFSQSLKEVSVDSIEFHLRDSCNDFESWLVNIMEEPRLAEEVKRIKSKNLKGEALKSSMNKFANKMSRKLA